MTRPRRLVRQTSARPHDGRPPAAPDVDVPVVRVSTPAELVGAVPHLVGFQPQHSVVVVSLRGPRLRCGLVARLDLPPDDVPASTVARHLVPFLLRDQPEQVVVLVYDERPWLPDDRPWQDLVDALEGELGERGVRVREASYVAGERFWSFTCRSGDCCPDEGTSLAHARSSVVVTELVARGSAPLASRRDVERLVDPVDAAAVAELAALAGDELARRLQAQEEAQEEQSPAGPTAAAARWEADVVRQFQVLGDRRRRHGAGGTRTELAVLLAGLRDTSVRDAVAMQCSAWAWLGPDAGATAHGAAAARPGPDDPVAAVLTDLATSSDGLWAVAPLTLLAMQRWAAGNGGLANAAVDRALRLDPDYRMARLVDQLLRSGTPPAWADRAGG